MKSINVRAQNDPKEILGLHFFAQCMDELLFDHTNDSYKAPALNLMTRAIELQMMADHVRTSGISAESLRSFLEELDWGIHIDPVLSEEHKQRLLRGLKRISSGTPSPTKVNDYSAWITDDLNGYFSDLRKRIEVTVLDGNKKTEIRALATSLSAHVEINRFSRRYAYQCVQRFLCNPLRTPGKISTQSVLATFLDCFERKEFGATVYFRGQEGFTRFKEMASKWDIFILDHLPDSVEQFSQKQRFVENDDLKLFVQVSDISTAPDPYAARDLAVTHLEQFLAAAHYQCHEEPLRYSKNSVVEMVKGESVEATYIVGPNPNPMLNRFSDGKIDEGEFLRIKEVIHGLHLTRQSTEKFINAIGYHKNAITSPSPENQLVALWSALEGLLPNPDSDIRIKYFIDIVSSVLVLAYPRKLFRVISRELAESGGDIVCDIQEIKKDSWIEKVIALICCEDEEKSRYLVASKLDSNPLLRYRMKELYDAFHSKKCIHKTLLRHKKKISWHINRIYWTRNLAVHSAESMPYIATIAENLHDYLDTLIDAISLYAVKTSTKANIERLIQMMLTDYEIRVESLVESSERTDVKCNHLNVIDLVHGKDNPFPL